MNYQEITKQFNTMPNAKRYDMKGVDLIRLTDLSTEQPMTAVYRAFKLGFIQGVKYSNNQEKRQKKAYRDPKCDPFR